MNIAVLLPVALGLSVIGLAGFFWSLRSGQYEDLDGAAERVLLEEAGEPPDEAGSTRHQD